MGATQTFRAARDAGLKLALNEDKDAVMAGPPHKITQHIRVSVRKNKDLLMRDLLFREAVDYLAAAIRQQGIPPGDPAVMDVYGVFTADPGALNAAWADAAWADADFETFRVALRERLKDARRALAAHPKPEPPPSTVAEPAGQGTLLEAS